MTNDWPTSRPEALSPRVLRLIAELDEVCLTHPNQCRTRNISALGHKETKADDR